MNKHICEALAAPEVRPLRTVQLKHSKKYEVEEFAVTPDGRLAVYGEECDHIRLWNLETGRCAAVLQSEGGQVGALAITPDGRRVVCGGDTVHLWDLSRSRTPVVLEGHTEFVTCVAITSDGRIAATGSDRGKLFLWDCATGARLRELRSHKDLIQALRFTEDGTRLISGGWDHDLRVWRVDSGRVLARFGGRCVHELDITPDGMTVVETGCGKHVRVWNVAKRRCIRSFRRSGGWPPVCVTPDARFTVNGDHLAWDDFRTFLLVREVKTGRYLARYVGHEECVDHVSLLRDGRVVSCDFDGVVHFWPSPAEVAARAGVTV